LASNCQASHLELNIKIERQNVTQSMKKSSQNKPLQKASTSHLRSYWPLYILVTFAIICLVFLAIMPRRNCAESSNSQENSQVQRYLKNLNLEDGEESSLRQLDIVMNAPDKPRNPDYTPVHILARPNEKFIWKFFATGALTNKHPGYLLTASHVVCGESLQFGFRVICKNALTGNEPILPIISCDLNYAPGDIVLCKTGDLKSGFPVLTLPKKPTTFQYNEDGSAKHVEGITVTYTSDEGKVTLLTDGRSVPCVIQGKSTTLEDLVYWPANGMTAGESGSLAVYEINNQQCWVMVIGGTTLKEDLRGPFNLEDVKFAYGIRFNIK
jgi:hypothetical protein